jgi:hypothetical protein
MLRKIGLSLLGILALVAMLFAFSDEKPAKKQSQVVQQVETVIIPDSPQDHEDEHGDDEDDGLIDTE